MLQTGKQVVIAVEGGDVEDARLLQAYDPGAKV
jgi:hypothetical protein